MIMKPGPQVPLTYLIHAYTSPINNNASTVNYAVLSIYLPLFVNVLEHSLQTRLYTWLNARRVLSASPINYT